MATVLTLVIQALVFGGLIACIVVGTQDRPSPTIPPITEVEHAGGRLVSGSPAAYSLVDHQTADIPANTGERSTLFFFYPITICMIVGYLFMTA